MKSTDKGTMTTINLKLPNFNNKMAADRFIHVFTKPGKYTLHEYKSEIHIILDDIPGTWKVTDIGTDYAGELPSWIYLFSHNCTRMEFMKATGVKHTELVYFFLFERNQP